MKVILGTRDSQLAVWQTKWVLQKLKEHNPDLEFIIKHIKTQGDKLLDVALSKIGDKGLFTKELEIALLNGEIDLAVHSMKDIPTTLPKGLKIGCITKRENHQDVLISPYDYTLDTLPISSKVGTSSLRRRAQLLGYRNDLKISDIRGNLKTRLNKMHQEGFAAIVLAAAGINRLGLTKMITQYLPLEISLPAVGQGSLGIEIRENDMRIETIINCLNDANTAYAVLAERALLAYLEGGCQIPIGAFADIKNGRLYLEAMVASLDGTRQIRDEVMGDVAKYDQLGIALAKRLLDKGAKEILKQVRQGNGESGK